MPPRTPITPAQAADYDRWMARLERRFFPDTRAWIGERAQGRTLEVGVGTGLNLAHYRPDVALVGVDPSTAMLAVARRRAADLGRPVALEEGDVEALPFSDGAFDTVVMTFGLCEVPDDRSAVAELVRVVRPGGRLLIADHVEATSRVLRAAQRALEHYTVSRSGEWFTRRPSQHLASAGARVVASQRFSGGAIERVHAERVDSLHP